MIYKLYSNSSGDEVLINFFFSFWDFKYFLDQLKRRNILKQILFFVCVSVIAWQVYEKIEIFLKKPTTASIGFVESKDLPISFTLCKNIIQLEFDGNFTGHKYPHLKDIEIISNLSELQMMDNKSFTYEFVIYSENPLMCKEFDFTGYEKDMIRILKEHGQNIDANLYLYIHQPGMFFLQEFGLIFENRKFHYDDNYDLNENVGIDVKSYDISNDPHLTCSRVSHFVCTNKEIIKEYNKTFGCTYPIQRYH